MPTTSQSIPLTPDQLAEINSLGAAAAAFVQANPNQPGAYVALYNYIEGLIPSGNIDQIYWFQEAAFVNANDSTQPASFFIRDMTQMGLQQQGMPSDFIY